MRRKKTMKKKRGGTIPENPTDPANPFVFNFPSFEPLQEQGFFPEESLPDFPEYRPPSPVPIKPIELTDKKLTNFQLDTLNLLLDTSKDIYHVMYKFCDYVEKYKQYLRKYGMTELLYYKCIQNHLDNPDKTEYIYNFTNYEMNELKNELSNILNNITSELELRKRNRKLTISRSFYNQGLKRKPTRFDELSHDIIEKIGKSIREPKKMKGGASNDSLEPEPEPEPELEPEEFPLGTRAEEWLPIDIENRLYKEIVGENEEWINNPHGKFYTKECSRLKEYCELFPKICYFNPEYLEKVKICQHIPYTCIRDSIRSIRTLDRYLNNRRWNYFFEREFYEYLSNGINIMRISSYLDDFFIEACDEIFSLNIQDYELDMSLRDFFTLLNQKSNSELSNIFLEILELSLEKYEPRYRMLPFQVIRGLDNEQQHIQRQIRLKSIIREGFCRLMELFTLGNRITNQMREDII